MLLLFAHSTTYMIYDQSSIQDVGNWVEKIKVWREIMRKPKNKQTQCIIFLYLTEETTKIHLLFRSFLRSPTFQIVFWHFGILLWHLDTKRYALMVLLLSQTFCRNMNQKTRTLKSILKFGAGKNSAESTSFPGSNAGTWWFKVLGVNGRRWR